MRQRVRGQVTATAGLAVALSFTAPSAHAMPIAQAAAATAIKCSKLVSVYGALSDGRLTYTSIDSTKAARERTVISTAKLGFVPKAMATLNYNTVLVTQPDGDLYRIDVITNTVESGLTFQSHRIASGWTHDKLTSDGYGHLYGTAGGRLLQYTLTASKPWAGRISTGKQIGTGFGLKTLASSGDDRLYATTASGGKLVEYTVSASGSWSRKDLVASGWGGFDQLVSPHGGLIYGQTSSGGMYWYEHIGSTVKYHSNDPVDASGWTQTILSAQPRLCGGGDTPSSDITLTDLENIYANISGDSVVTAGLSRLNEEMRKGEINNPARKAAFLATLRNESAFKYNAVEGGSFTYRGRGFIQLTGEFNYRPAGRYLGIDLVGSPSLAATERWSAPIANWYWNENRDINPLADDLDMAAVNIAIGYAPSAAEDAERCVDFKKALKYFNGGTLPGGINCDRRNTAASSADLELAYARY